MLKQIVLFLFISSNPGCGLFSADKCEYDQYEKYVKVIDALASNGQIRTDQAEARKKSLKEEWEKYTREEISCKDFIKKADYLSSR